MIVVQTSEFVVKYQHHFLLHHIILLLLLIIIVTIASVPSASICGPEQSERVYTQAHLSSGNKKVNSPPFLCTSKNKLAGPLHTHPFCHSTPRLLPDPVPPTDRNPRLSPSLRVWSNHKKHTSDISHGHQNMSIERDLLFQTKSSLRSNSKLQGHMLVSLKIEKTKGLLCLMSQSFHQTTNK